MDAYSALKPILFRFSPETAHNFVVRALHPLPASSPPKSDERLTTVVAGIRFPTPLGLAAGFDKDAKTPGRMLGYGFGFVEVGTVTPLPQEGSSAERYFRLQEDRAVINRMGFPSEGHQVVLRRMKRRIGKPGVVGVNIGANKDSDDRIADYEKGIRLFSEVADYLTVNISSPNTPGLRELQTGAFLKSLLGRISEARQSARHVPIFLKVAPDLADDDIKTISNECLAAGLDGIVVANTTVSRPTLISALKSETGGLSGEPLKPLALQILRKFRSELGGRLPLIGVGGVSSPEDVYDRIKAGASLVQLYTALAYQGTSLIRRSNAYMLSAMKSDGFANVAEAVGTE